MLFFTAPTRVRVTVILLVWLGCLSVSFARISRRTVHASERDQKTAPSSDVLSATEIFKRVSHAVFVVEGLDDDGNVVAMGSGVAVSEKQLITNRHLVTCCRRFRIRQSENSWPAVLTAISPEQSIDLATLTGYRLRAVTVPKRDSRTIEVGERVYAIGAPLGIVIEAYEHLKPIDAALAERLLKDASQP